MPRKSKALSEAQDSSCAIRRSLGVLSDPWSFLLLREALLGRQTFAEFRDELGIATDILTSRLNNFVEHGIMQKVPYREPGQRTRHAYVLTAAGEELKVVLIALQQWGNQHLPSPKSLSVRPVVRDTEQPVRVILVDLEGALVDQADTEFIPADAPLLNAG
jgi:DNA-binding HxlR family transcriptional regulator